MSAKKLKEEIKGLKERIQTLSEINEEQRSIMEEMKNESGQLVDRIRRLEIENERLNDQLRLTNFRRSAS